MAFSGGFELRLLIDHSNERAALVEQAAAQKKAQDKADTATKEWEDKLSKLRTANGKLTKRLQNETNKAVYSTCVVPADGVQLYNDALGHASGGSNASLP